MALPSKCPLCGAKRTSQNVISSHVFGRISKDNAFFQCSNCEVIYQYPPLTKVEEIKFYKEEFEGFMNSRSKEETNWLSPKDHVNNNKKNFLRRKKFLDKALTKSTKILEYGCSSGFMLYPLKKRGLECFGIEPSGLFRDFVNKNGINTYENLLELKKDISFKFDLIIHFFVLEHISDPINFLKDQIKLLSKKGKIIFEIPNSNDPLYKVYDLPEFERFYWSKAHPWYFNENSIEFILKKLKVKYKIYRHQRYDLSNHIFWAKEGKPGGTGKYTDLLGKNLEESYKKNLIKSGFCDTLFVEISKS